MEKCVGFDSEDSECIDAPQRMSLQNDTLQGHRQMLKA
jgi:hypothetical protein